MKRIIKVTTVYDLDDPELKGCQITPIEKVKSMVEKDIESLDWHWDEGWIETIVEVVDE